MPPNRKIKIPVWDLRGYQREVFAARDRGINNILMLWCRRAGKDLTCMNFIAREAVKRVGTYIYLLPYYAQARKAIWEGVTSDGRRYIDAIPKELRKRISNQDMVIELKNDSIVRLLGSDNPDSLVGQTAAGIVYSEYALQNPQCYDLMRPVLRESKGWQVVNSTPRGRNHYYDLYSYAAKAESWHVSKVTWQETGYLTEEDLEAERASGMDDDMIEQEYNCSFAAGMKGAYYAEEVERARREGRITEVPVNPDYPVYTFWDLGMGDQTAIWMVQPVGYELRVVDYFEGHSKPLGYYVEQLRDRGYDFAEHWLPHDANQRSIQTGKTTAEMLEDYLYSSGRPRPVEIAPKTATKEDSIRLGRSLIRRAVFDGERCWDGLRCLENYMRKFDERRKVFVQKPEHNWASHGADAWQTIGLSDAFDTGMVRDTGGSFDEPLHSDNGRTISDFSVFDRR